MGNIDKCLSPFPSMTNLTAKHDLPANAKTEEKDKKQILTNLLHTLTQLPTQTNSMASTGSINSVHAYPLVKAQDPPDAFEVLYKLI